MADKEEKEITITFRVTEDFEGLRERLDVAAKKVKRTRNNFICWVLSGFIDSDIPKNEDDK